MRKRLLAIVATAALVVAMVPSMVFAAGETVLPNEMNGTWGGAAGTTVYYNGNYYNTMKDALAAVYESTPTDTAKVYCKPGSNVGTMSHVHVADNLTVYGNGAELTPGGDQDIEIDTFKYDRTDGKNQNAAGVTLEKDITVTIDNLSGIAVWGQRNTNNTVNIVLQNCENIHKVYISGTSGVNNITIKNCGFDSSSNNCTVYSNAAGSVTVENCTFDGINEPININTKATSGDMKTTVKDCIFTDCGLGTAGDSQWAAPIRVVNSGGADVALDVDNCEFDYTGTNESANGDVLVGDGRENSTNNPIAATVTNSDAEIQVQETGYYDPNGGKDEEKVTVTTVAADEKATVGTDGKVTVSDNTQTGTKPGADKPDNSPNTGDNSMAPFAVAGIALAAMTAVVVTRRRENQ